MLGHWKDQLIADLEAVQKTRYDVEALLNEARRRDQQMRLNLTEVKESLTEISRRIRVLEKEIRSLRLHSIDDEEDEDDEGDAGTTSKNEVNISKSRSCSGSTSHDNNVDLTQINQFDNGVEMTTETSKLMMNRTQIKSNSKKRELPIYSSEDLAGGFMFYCILLFMA
ncbi:unnamed protein product [Protopolystoma xenopodis]|uniref:Uncharacterized protein n=1 Tax=Protopolystoma xenopodis TaxID=117903 RepID=A0A3S5CP48_9PLAT|nr:unnamed protein product [Protopolystoma xenopodis]